MGAHLAQPLVLSPASPGSRGSPGLEFECTYIPPEVFVEIFVLLPPPEILGLRLVSCSWNHLITHENHLWNRLIVCNFDEANRPPPLVGDVPITSLVHRDLLNHQCMTRRWFSTLPPAMHQYIIHTTCWKVIQLGGGGGGVRSKIQCSEIVAVRLAHGHYYNQFSDLVTHFYLTLRDGDVRLFGQAHRGRASERVELDYENGERVVGVFGCLANCGGFLGSIGFLTNRGREISAMQNLRHRSQSRPSPRVVAKGLKKQKKLHAAWIQVNSGEVVDGCRVGYSPWKSDL